MATMVAGGPDRESLHSGKWEKKEDLMYQASVVAYMDNVTH